MKFKKFSAILAMMILMTLFGASAVALDTSNNSNISPPPSASPKEQPKLTDEQKAELKAKHDEMKAIMENANKKWLTLTDAQKEEIYALRDKTIDIKGQIIDKYLALGLIDAKTANSMKTKLMSGKEKMRENGAMPFFGKKFKKMKNAV